MISLLTTDSSRTNIIYSDIDSGADVDLFCDGHDLPFQDGVVDAVVTTAVLEHVLYPERVAAEIVRVLSSAGCFILNYHSCNRFMRVPMISRATRFRVIGAFFNRFPRLTLDWWRALLQLWSGLSKTLLWLWRRIPLFRKLSKAFVRFVFGWIKYLDYLLENRPEAMDGASCTYIFWLQG